MQDAILAVSLDDETPQGEGEKERGYHAFSLGLCADTCANLERRGLPLDLAAFSMTSEETRTLATRFLRSLGGDGSYAEWLRRLALTPVFDEQAARAAFSDDAGAEQDFAWRTLRSYRFVRSVRGSADDTMHARMREALAAIERDEEASRWCDRHQWWRAHWSERTDDLLDLLSARAWYHRWHLEPEEALTKWTSHAESARSAIRMAEHHSLLTWWAPCDLESRLTREPERMHCAQALHGLSNEFQTATA